MSGLTQYQVARLRAYLYHSWGTCYNCMRYEGGHPVWIAPKEDLWVALQQILADIGITPEITDPDEFTELIQWLELACPNCGTAWSDAYTEVGKPLMENRAVTIAIPRINDGLADYGALFDIWAQANAYRLHVTFDFSQCDFLRPNALAFLGGLARLVESRRGIVEFRWDTFRLAVREKLLNAICQCGFAGAFGHPRAAWDGNSIPYREDPASEPDKFADYLSDLWLGKGWVNISDRLRDAIVERVLEIYMNAFEHAHSEIGVFTCGQHFPNNHELTLAIIDFGVGIPTNVREYLKTTNPGISPERIEKLPSSKCLKWAFESGTTTQPNGTGRGMGLDLLKAFIQKNQGTLEVYSQNGHARISSAGEDYEDCQTGFEGTAVQIRLKCDETKYFILAGEKD